MSAPPTSALRIALLLNGIVLAIILLVCTSLPASLGVDVLFIHVLLTYSLGKVIEVHHAFALSLEAHVDGRVAWRGAVLILMCVALVLWMAWWSSRRDLVAPHDFLGGLLRVRRLPSGVGSRHVVGVARKALAHWHCDGCRIG